MIYITDLNIDDICCLGKIISIESCKECKYCKKLHRIIEQGNRIYINNIFLKVECNYEK